MIRQQQKCSVQTTSVGKRHWLYKSTVMSACVRACVRACVVWRCHCLVRSSCVDVLFLSTSLSFSLSQQQATVHCDERACVCTAVLLPACQCVWSVWEVVLLDGQPGRRHGCRPRDTVRWWTDGRRTTTPHSVVCLFIVFGLRHTQPLSFFTSSSSVCSMHLSGCLCSVRIWTKFVNGVRLGLKYCVVIIGNALFVRKRRFSGSDC